VTLLLHCCYTAATLLLHCCDTMPRLSTHTHTHTHAQAVLGAAHDFMQSGDFAAFEDELLRMVD
jgi:Tfp pilus assembly protein PilF